MLCRPVTNTVTNFSVLTMWSFFAVHQLDLLFGKLLPMYLNGHIITLLCKKSREWLLVREVLQCLALKDVFFKKSPSNRRSLKSLESSRHCEHFCGKITYVNKQNVTKLPSISSKFSIVFVQDLPLMLDNGSKESFYIPNFIFQLSVLWNLWIAFLPVTPPELLEVHSENKKDNRIKGTWSVV